MVRLVAKVDGTAIGNGQVSFWRGRGEIGSLVVAASFRQRGIGDELLAALIEQGRSRGLAVLELWADPACQWLQTWYRRRGFCPVETRMLPHDERVVVLRMALGIAGE
jgi:N-acetylglutamate synthase-like GNAT family acetyltransferase